MNIKISDRDDAQRLLDFYHENRTHLIPWEPERPDYFYTSEYWDEQIETREAEMLVGRALFFIALNDEGKMIASCNLTNIVHGVFQAGYLGYAVAKAYEGKGVMKSLCQHVIRHAFDELKLNRIMANYLPHNERSARLLESLGFEREGYARRYLKIHDRWQDHVLTALVNPNSSDNGFNE